jgi:hypothetical protein
LSPHRFALVPLVIAAIAACDPVHSDAVNALGGEAPGVPRGPNHRPGQPCLLCHDGKLGDPREFSVAGTVFDRVDSKQGLSNVLVVLTDHDGHTLSKTTNGAGNFYATPSEWSPHYPVKVSLTYGSPQKTVSMTSHVGRDGSCAGCHFDPQGPDTPGHVYFNGDLP